MASCGNTSQSVDLLNLRLREVESQLFGSDEFSDSITKQQQSQPPNAATLVATLSEIDQKLRSLTIGKDRFAQCYAELRKFETWITSPDDRTAAVILDSASSENDSTKFEEVLAFEEEIILDGKMAERITALEPTVDRATEKLQTIPEFVSTLDQMKTELLQTRQQVRDLEDECRVTIDQIVILFGDVASKLDLLNIDLTAAEQRKEEAKNE